MDLERAGASWPGRVRRRLRFDSLLRNSLYIMSTTAVTAAFGFVFWLVAARLCPPEVVGVTAAVVSLSTIIVLISSLGVGGALIQSLAHQDSDQWSRIFWAGLTAALAGAVALVAVAVLLVPLVSADLGPLRRTSIAVLFALGTVALVAGAVLDYAFIAERSAGSMLSRNLTASTAKVVGAVLLAALAGATLLTLLEAWALAAAVGAGVGGLLLARHVHLRRPEGPADLARTLRRLRYRIAGNQVIGIGSALLPYLLPLVVTARLSARDTAYFYTTWMMAGIFLIIAPAVSQSLFAEGVHSPDDLRARARSSLVITGVILVPGILAAALVGQRLLSVFGPNYADHATGLLRIALIAAVPDALVNVYVSVLRVRGRLTAAAALTSVIAGGTVLLSWILLPVAGIDAVGWSFLVMQLVGVALVMGDRAASRGWRSPITRPAPGAAA